VRQQQIAGRLGGMATRGERKASSKLTESAVRDIRATTGQRQPLAQKHGVHPKTIDAIRRRDWWKHV